MIKLPQRSLSSQSLGKYSQSVLRNYTHAVLNNGKAKGMPQPSRPSDGDDGVTQSAHHALPRPSAIHRQKPCTITNMGASALRGLPVYFLPAYKHCPSLFAFGIICRPCRTINTQLNYRRPSVRRHCSASLEHSTARSSFALIIIRSRRQQRSVASTQSGHDDEPWTIQHEC